MKRTTALKTDGRSQTMESAADILKRMQKEARKREREAPPTSFFVDSELIRPEDIAYVHSIFMQCFLPLRHSAKNAHFWQTNCGNASLLIAAGRLINPARPNQFLICKTPAGPKARIVATYIDDYAWTHDTPVIDMGDNMHQSMKKIGIKIGGQNAKAFIQEVQNFAAAEINLGLWEPGGPARQEIAKVAKSLSFWIEKNPEQGTLWQPQMTLSAGPTPISKTANTWPRFTGPPLSPCSTTPALWTFTAFLPTDSATDYKSPRSFTRSTYRPCSGATLRSRATSGKSF